MHSDLVFRLKDQASPKPTAVGITLPALLLEAADALEASDKREAELKSKIANLELELAKCKTSRQRAREDILRALDKRLSEDK